MAIVEGRTTLDVDPSGTKGPGAKGDAPFYNPAMQVNRDLSIALVTAEAHRRGRDLDIADVLAGAGARTLRLAHEVPAELTVFANDADPEAIAHIGRGVKDNGIDPARVQATEGPARRFLAARRFDIVDVDPYGSPMPFLDAALQATRHDGILCLTATDTGALCGTYPKACRRRYGAEPLHGPAWRAEVGLRILQATVVRAAGRVDRGAEPVFAVARGHWMRVAMRIKDGRAVADRGHRLIGHVVEDEATGRGVRTEAGAGPLYWGALHDSAILDEMAGLIPSGTHPETEPLMDLLRAEADAPPFWVPIDALPSRHGGDMPRRHRFIAALQAEGAEVAPSHMDPLGVRTDAPAAAVVAAWKSLL